MSKIMTRRAALTGSVAGAAAIVADAASSKGELTLALANEHADAELLVLERRPEALLPPMAQAMAAHGEAYDRAMEMMSLEPAELKYCGNDARLGFDPPPHCVWNKLHVKNQRDKWRHKREVQARFEEMLASKRQREQVWRDVADASGWTDAGNEESRFWDQTEAILPRACEIEPRTMEGVAIKARFTAIDAWLLMFNNPELDMDWHEKVAHGFVAGMMRLGGRDFLMRPWEVQA